MYLFVKFSPIRSIALNLFYRKKKIRSSDSFKTSREDFCLLLSIEFLPVRKRENNLVWIDNQEKIKLNPP